MAKTKTEQKQQDIELADVWPDPPVETVGEDVRTISGKFYREELARLQVELVKLQEWIRHRACKVVVIFEGRDAAGKGGAIKTITLSLNPRSPASSRCRRRPSASDPVVFPALRRAPARGRRDGPVRPELVQPGRRRARHGLLHRGRVPGVPALRAPSSSGCSSASGIMLVKYWFSVSDAEQERRFQARLEDPTKRWKLSPMDLESRARWVEYSKAKDEMFAYTDIKQAPWYVVNADDKKRARLNLIRHLLSLIPYEDLTPEPIELPPRQPDPGYVRPPIGDQTFVPEVY